MEWQITNYMSYAWGRYLMPSGRETYHLRMNGVHIKSKIEEENTNGKT